MSKLGKPRRLVAATNDPLFRSRIEEMGSRHEVETVFSSLRDEIISSAHAILPSIALLDLSSKAHDLYVCCAELEVDPNITVYVCVPDSEWESMTRGTHEVYGWGYDIATCASELLDDLELVIERRYDEISRKRGVLW